MIIHPLFQSPYPLSFYLSIYSYSLHFFSPKNSRWTVAFFNLINEDKKLGKLKKMEKRKRSPLSLHTYMYMKYYSSERFA